MCKYLCEFIWGAGMCAHVWHMNVYVCEYKGVGV